MEIVEFLTARLDEMEAAANEFYTKRGNDPFTHHNALFQSRAAVLGHQMVNEPRFSNIEYEALNWVLADVTAKRAIIADNSYRPHEGLSDSELHARCAHPAYEYDTTEGQRKAWARADEPPEGDGWERNIDAGRDGWDRLDYTEESYWRRLRPDGPEPKYVPKVLRQLALPYAGHPDYDWTWRP